MAWFEQSFGEDYLKVYGHRTLEAAEQEISSLLQWFPLKKNSYMLDLCCGTGRHSVVLQRLGHRVTGMDLSVTLLREARERDPEKQIPFIQADMRHLPFLEEEYDAVCNLFTSFGYMETELEDQQVLNEIHRVLRPGGLFLIDFLNPAYVRRHLVPESTKEVEGEIIEEKRWIEGDRVHKQIRIGNRVYEEKVRLYSREQLQHMLNEAGLEVYGVCGSFAGESYEETTSNRMIFWGHKQP